MSHHSEFRHAALIEQSLELLAGICEDPSPVVYRLLFERHPQMEPYFWRDTNDAIKGEMLSRTFSAILDFVGERQYAGHMIGTEMVTHEGYDVPREVFITFFDVVRDAVREILDTAWTLEIATAWVELLSEIYLYAQRVPRSDVVSAYYAPRLTAFQNGEAPP